MRVYTTLYVLSSLSLSPSLPHPSSLSLFPNVYPYFAYFSRSPRARLVPPFVSLIRSLGKNEKEVTFSISKSLRDRASCHRIRWNVWERCDLAWGGSPRGIEMNFSYWMNSFSCFPFFLFSFTLRRYLKNAWQRIEKTNGGETVSRLRSSNKRNLLLL